MELTLGTTNLAKGRELLELLQPFGFCVQTLQDVSDPLDVVEDGDSFAANAQAKACQQAKHLGCWVLADDSGLEVDALKGAPGIYSARYAGENASDAENNTKLLKELVDAPPAKRTARYYCHVAVADPTGTLRAESCGICRGRIRTEAAGTNGFGYDPLFEVREYHQTFGELGPNVKRVLSHRGRAMRAIVPKLVRIASSGVWDQGQTKKDEQTKKAVPNR
ncbi:MAG: RdgB/HAM1 family non-canonical purine NTP pyrophosphatase [Pirellulales bacterium]|nr:RdgB/HAM1 family non-canonical purine NTP pyrophosphatase [Pirellulales bacterium]